jgi:glutamine amidotransferase
MNTTPEVAIVDYGLGNLFSVKHACEFVGIDATITRETAEIETADGVILPGVGAFNRAMDSLRDLGLIDVLKAAPESGQPLIGICLGAQLLLNESYEFGRHDGLGLVPGSVRRLDDVVDIGSESIPHISWERVNHESHPNRSPHSVNPFTGIKDGEYMYFVHSFCIDTDDKNVAATTQYGGGTFCSTVVSDNVVGFQFHPERSGPKGLQIYENIHQMLQEGKVDD